MSNFGKFKLSDAIGQSSGGKGKAKGKGDAKATAAEQAREALEAAQIKNAGGHGPDAGRSHSPVGRQQGGGRRGK